VQGYTSIKQSWNEAKEAVRGYGFVGVQGKRLMVQGLWFRVSGFGFRG